MSQHHSAPIVTAPGDYLTRDGRRVTIHSIDGRGMFSASGAIWKMFRGKLRPRGYHIWRPADGAFRAVGQSRSDIVSAAPPPEPGPLAPPSIAKG